MKQQRADQTEIAAAMRALGHPVRLSILSILAEKREPQCCCQDVTQSLPLAQSTVSQHIKVLMEAGLICRFAKGTRNCYTINFDRLEALKNAYAAYLGELGTAGRSASARPQAATESV